jgi:hypothetical protein
MRSNFRVPGAELAGNAESGASGFVDIIVKLLQIEGLTVMAQFLKVRGQPNPARRF